MNFFPTYNQIVKKDGIYVKEEMRLSWLATIKYILFYKLAISRTLRTKYLHIEFWHRSPYDSSFTILEITFPRSNGRWLYAFVWRYGRGVRWGDYGMTILNYPIHDYKSLSEFKK